MLTMTDIEAPIMKKIKIMEIQSEELLFIIVDRLIDDLKYHRM